MFDSLRPAEHAMLAALLVASVQQDAVPLDDFVAGLKMETDDLSGLRCVLPVAMAMAGWCSLPGRGCPATGLGSLRGSFVPVTANSSLLHS